MPGCLHARPSANLTSDAALTWAVGSANADYPLANLATLEPDVVAKANQTTATVRATFGGATALEGVVVINCNFPGIVATLSNNGGMVAQPRTAPEPEDGLCIGIWWDLREVANASGTQWNIAVAGAPAAIAMGSLLLVETWEELRIRWGYDIRDVFPVIEHRTGHRKRLQYRIPVRTRRFAGTPFYAEDRAALRALRREAYGSIIPFAFIPDVTDDDVLLVQFVGEEHEERYEFVDGRFDDASASGVVEQPIALEEVNAGVRLAP